MVVQGCDQTAAAHTQYQYAPGLAKQQYQQHRLSVFVLQHVWRGFQATALFIIGAKTKHATFAIVGDNNITQFIRCRVECFYE
jgi:hypothetical protein